MRGDHVDVLIVTALKDELDAVLELEIGGRSHDAWRGARDQSGFPYHLRELPNDYGEKLLVAAAWSGEMGGEAAAVRAAQLILELDPACLAMCGICAGWRGKVFLGDVIVADRVFSYDSGKQSAGNPGADGSFHDITTYNLEATWKMDSAYFAREFQQAPRLKKERPLSKDFQTQWLLYRLDEHERQAGPSPLEHPERKALCQNWGACIKALRNKGLVVNAPGELKLTEQGRRAVAEARLLDPEGLERDPAFRVHVAPIATGSAVREEPGLFDRLSRHVRKVLGAEMEARAIGFVAEQLGRRRAIIVKAVSDYAEPDKDDAYRSFACHASAAFLLAFLQKHLRPEHSSRTSGPGDEVPLKQELREVEDEAQQHDEFLAAVEQACMLRHPEGARITRRKTAPPFGSFLEVAVPEGRFGRIFPVAAIEQPITEELLQSFLDGIHADYQKRNPGVRSTLVHAGPAAPEELARKAFVRGVLLASFGEYQGLFDFSAYLQRQTARLESDPVYPPALYVEQRARVSVGGQEPTRTDDVLRTLREMLDSPHPRFALVLGDFGTGKTFLLHELARRMAQEQAPLVPVLIEMRSLQKHRSLKALIAQHFAAADVGRLEPDQFLYMLQQGRIALLFDGFDELALRVAYDQVMEHFGTLIEAAQGQAKVIVTSRTQHFLTDHEVQRELGERAALLPGYRLIKLERFSEEQVYRFLVKRLESEPAAKERLELLRDVRDLLGLSQNPRLLGFIAELDAESLQNARARSGEITSAKLYELLIDRWLKGEHQRVTPSGAPKGLTIQQLRSGTTSLAMLLWERTDRTVDIHELPEVLLKAVTAGGEQVLENEVIRHQLGSGSLLVRDEEGRFSFVHQSVLEWLVADAAAQSVRGGRDATVLSRGEMSDLMADFFIALAGAKAAKSWSEARTSAGEDIAKRNALRVLRRLQSLPAGPKDPDTAKAATHLEGNDLRGQNLSGIDLRRANLQNANLSGVTLVKTNLTDAQLRGAQLVHADLSGAVLLNVDLVQADLSRANLLGADLRGAQLQGAKLRAAKLTGARVDSLEGCDTFGAAMPGELIANPILAQSSQGFAVAFSPTDHGLVASGHGDGSIRIWDVVLGRLLVVLRTHTDAVRSVAFSPDGRLLAAASNDWTLSIWSVEGGHCLHELQAHDAAVRAVAFSPDGTLVASASEDETLKLWSVENGQLLHEFRDHQAAALGVAFSPDGSLLASGSADRTVRLWSVGQGKAVHVFHGHLERVGTVAFSPDGRTLASGAADRTITIWNLPERQPQRVLRGHGDAVLGVAFSPDGKVLASASADRTLVLWSIDQGSRLRALSGHSGQVSGVAFNQDGTSLASASQDKTVRLWSVAQGHLLNTFKNQASSMHSLAFSLGGATLASGSGDQSLTLWDTDQGHPLHIFKKLPGNAFSVAFSPVDKSLLAAAYSNGIIQLLDSKRGEAKGTLVGRSSLVFDVAFSPDGQTLASASDDQAITLWSLDSAQKTRALRGHSSYVFGVAFKPDGKMLASASADKTVALWSMDHDKPVRLLQAHSSHVRAVAFSPSGELLASGSDDTTITVWKVNKGRPHRVLKKHGAPVVSVTFSPDSTMLASGSTDRTVILWNVREGVELHRLQGHSGGIARVAFTPNGKVLASAAHDGTVCLWDVVRGSLLATMFKLQDGWVTFKPDGRFKSGGEIAGAFWHAIGLCRFEPGELDPYLPTPLRLPDDEPLLPES
jgi:WD40 repeat protein/nucleoside phosphorylase